MSMGSCLVGRRRKKCRSLILKLFSRCFAFIVIPYLLNANGRGPSPCGGGGILQSLFRGSEQKWRDKVQDW